MKYFSFILSFLFIMAFNPGAFANKNDTVKSDTAKKEQQDLAFSFFNNINTNPAYTGIKAGPTLQLKAEIDKPFMTHGFLYRSQQYTLLSDVAFGKRKNDGIGFSFVEAKGGIMANMMLGLSYAHTFDLSRSSSFYHKLKIGVKFDFNHLTLDYTKSTWGDEIDPSLGFIYFTSEAQPKEFKKNYPSFNIGASYNNPNLYFGFAVQNVVETNLSEYSISKIPRIYNISIGGNIHLNKDFTLHPSATMNLIKGFKGKFNSYEPAILCQYKEDIILGLSYMDLNKITIRAGAVFFKFITLSAACGFSTNTDLNGFGTPIYLGGDLRINFKNI